RRAGRSPQGGGLRTAAGRRGDRRFAKGGLTMGLSSTNSNASAPVAAVYALTAIALGAIGATLFFTHFGNQIAGAKEPVAVAVRPDATATLAAAAVGADKKPETESKPESGTGIFKGTVT